ncbi:SMI1/KNR4 family protein [Shimazuella kribbensis]|uniref:SMI1/KNR4 family protein n=1 Tax=Shimazuella kribbensis TaxID=139808 RepID=UPI00040FC99E|nr:SMI1/KNR4 family protein [Shimazuella kribbensis]
MVNWLLNENEPEDFTPLENVIKASLPSDYKSFFHKYIGFYEEYEVYYPLDGYRYQVQNFYDTQEIIEVFEEVNSELEKHQRQQAIFVPFGENSALDRYQFYYDKVKGKEPVVVFTDRIDAFNFLHDDGSLNQDFVTILAPTFTQFVQRFKVETE